MEWVRRLFSRRRRYQDLSVSIQEHLEEKADELIEQGMSREEAMQLHGVHLAMSGSSKNAGAKNGPGPNWTACGPASNMPRGSYGSIPVLR